MCDEKNPINVGAREKNPGECNCWLCGSTATVEKKAGLKSQALSIEDFKVTDKRYGIFLSIFECSHCGFLFCPDGRDVEKFYVGMADSQYEAGRASRRLQARKIIQKLKDRGVHSGKLLDIGAGSGALVQEAILSGYDAEGLEPCRWMVSNAETLDVPVRQGTLETYQSSKSYDIITCVDVVEHVPNPDGLIAGIASKLKPGGIALLITPDYNSWARKILKYRWWHFRIAHISYFTKSSLEKVCSRNGLVPKYWGRPAWYFSISYLMERLVIYFPLLRHFPVPRALNKVVIPVNLYDSLYVIVRKEI